MRVFIFFPTYHNNTHINKRIWVTTLLACWDETQVCIWWLTTSTALFQTELCVLVGWAWNSLNIKVGTTKSFGGVDGWQGVVWRGGSLVTPQLVATLCCKTEPDFYLQRVLPLPTFFNSHRLLRRLKWPYIASPHVGRSLWFPLAAVMTR